MRFGAQGGGVFETDGKGAKKQGVRDAYPLPLGKYYYSLNRSYVSFAHMAAA